jgi:hypothetical protein
MEKKMNKLFFIVLMAAISACFTIEASAEESVIITLHEQIGREVEAMKQGFEQLGQETPAMAESRDWVLRARELPKDSPEFAHARAQFVAARSQDLEYRVMVAEQTYHSTVQLTDAIDRLIEVQSEATNGQSSVLGGETDEVIMRKARELQGIDRMMTALIRAGDAQQLPKVKMAQQAFQVKMKNTLARIHSNNASGLEKLSALRDSSEGLSFLMRAYAEGLELVHMNLTMLALSGHADAVFNDASLVIGDALGMLDPENMESEDLEFFMGATSTGYTDMIGETGYRSDMTGEIGAAADYLRSNPD